MYEIYPSIAEKGRELNLKLYPYSTHIHFIIFSALYSIAFKFFKCKLYHEFLYDYFNKVLAFIILFSSFVGLIQSMLPILVAFLLLLLVYSEFKCNLFMYVYALKDIKILKNIVRLIFSVVQSE